MPEKTGIDIEGAIAEIEKQQGRELSWDEQELVAQKMYIIKAAVDAEEIVATLERRQGRKLSRREAQPTYDLVFAFAAEDAVAWIEKRRGEKLSKSGHDQIFLKMYDERERQRGGLDMGGKWVLGLAALKVLARLVSR